MACRTTPTELEGVVILESEVHGDEGGFFVETYHQLLVPVGFGHGFLVLSEVADIPYRCTGCYAPRSEGAVAWNDPDLGIDWPLAEPVLPERDRAAQRLSEYLARPAFHYGE